MPELLLIEDDTDLRKVICEALEIDGHKVTIARDAEEALTTLSQEYQPDIILCDISLPHMNGLEFLTHVRKNPRWTDILFIAMSGSLTLKQKTMELGANYYLLKPFSFQQLYAMLAQREPPEN